MRKTKDVLIADWNKATTLDEQKKIELEISIDTRNALWSIFNVLETINKTLSDMRLY